MKLTARLFSVLVLAFLISPIILFQGCGDNKNIPDGSTITILPETVDLTDLGGLGETVVDFKVVVRYADGTPIPYANLVITGKFAIPSPTATYQFYWDSGGDQFNASPIPVDNGFKPQTDKNGVYDFSIVVFPATAFFDDIVVTSGTAVGQTHITLTKQ